MNQQYADAGVKIVGASADSVADNKAFAEKYGFPFDLITDTERTLPALIMDKKRWAAYVEDGDVKKVWEVRNIKKFPAEALEEIKAM